MRPASPHFPWKLDTDLNSKLCWPNAGLSLTSLCNAWNKLRRPVGDQTVFKFTCIPMTLPFTQAMLILALSTKVNQPLCNHWTSWSPVLQQWPEWESYDYNYKSTQLGNSFTVLLARHNYTTKESLIIPTFGSQMILIIHILLFAGVSGSHLIMYIDRQLLTTFVSIHNRVSYHIGEHFSRRYTWPPLKMKTKTLRIWRNERLFYWC